MIRQELEEMLYKMDNNFILTDELYAKWIEYENSDDFKEDTEYKDIVIVIYYFFFNTGNISIKKWIEMQSQ